MYLNAHSYFSFNYGTLSPESLLEHAAQKGWHSVGLCDINNTSGLADFFRLAPKYAIKPLGGVSFYNGHHFLYTCIARSLEGVREINDFLSHHQQLGLSFPAVPPYFGHVFVVYPFGKEYRLLKKHEYCGIRLSQLHLLKFTDWSKHTDKVVLLQPFTFVDGDAYRLHKLLRAIGGNSLLSRITGQELAQPDERMVTPKELQVLCYDYPFLLHNTAALQEQCMVNFGFGINKNKKTFTGNTYQDRQLLQRLTSEGLNQRYDTVTAAIQERIQRELQLIDEMGFAAYFLINQDIVRYAQHKNYFYVGRGSGANSLVAYCLRITDVDPMDLDLYFERFINQYRVNPPDFDIDFSWRDRDDVQRYIFEKHGRAHVALLGTYVTYQSRAVIRELGKVFGLAKAEIDDLVATRKNPKTPDAIVKHILHFSKRLHDMPHHLSIHAGGVVISDLPIHYYSGTYLPPKGLPTTHISMLEAEDLGLYKFDILSQRGLGHIKDAAMIIAQNRGEVVDVHAVSQFKQDDRIKQHISSGRCMGCFYVESPAMRMLLRKLKTETYLGLVAASSIIRPGVARSGMMRAFIERTHQPDKIEYIHPLMKELMEETHGVMVYQEDVIKVAHHFAGMSLADADVLRRGMSGKFRSREEFQKAKDKFVEGCRARGYGDEVTFEVWRQVESFAGYSFSKGHSASYAVESYQSLFLKAYYPLEFMVAVINNFGGFYKTEFYVHEARMCGADVQAPCINHSDLLTNISGKTIYLGFIHMAALERRVVTAICYERSVGGAYWSLQDFMDRVSISVEQLRLLVRIGAFRFTGRSKKQLLWDIHMIAGNKSKTNPLPQLFAEPSAAYALPDLQHHRYENALDEMDILGFPLCSPFDLISEKVPPSTVLSVDMGQYKGRSITMLGYLVTIKPTRTIKGEEMCFGTWIDAQGVFFDTTHFPNTNRQYPFRGSGCYLITGIVDDDFDACSLRVQHMRKLGWINHQTLYATAS